ncbi:hypothetical protein KFU94_47795 [Chloroflexi bacterium TSY]|nr:hypothetical protein [Chloroflexi bacterium TSY]
MNSIEEYIRGWDAIFDHRTGTDGDHETAAWLTDTIWSIGAEPHLDAFSFPRRVLRECAVRVENQTAEGVPLFDGGTTTEKDISAALTLLAGDVAAEKRNGIGVTSFSPISGHSPTHRLHKARTKQYQAIVAYGAADGIVPGLALLNAPRYMDPYGPPVLQISTEHGKWLEAAAFDNALAHLVSHVTIEQTHASNVQTKIAGRDPTLAPLVIMTPCSAWWTCTAERAGGIALWLECIRHFADRKGDRDVIFTANTGHELGHIGLTHYLDQQPNLVREAHAWIHLGANFAAVDSNIRYQASADLMQLGLDAFVAKDVTPKTITPVGTQPLGEAYNIHDGGGRYLSLLGDNRWFHHPDDRWPETIDLGRTEKLNRAMLKIVTALASA